MDQQQPNPNTSLFQLNLDAANSYTLKSAATWARVFGVLGLIIAILFIITGAYQASGGGQRYNDYYSQGVSRQQTLIAGIYIAVGVVYLLCSIFTITAGNKIIKALRTNDQNTLSSGFAALRNYFALLSILIIIGIILIGIGLAANGGAIR